MHPWHEVDLGENVPNIVNAIIEVSKGPKAKYELDKKSGLIRLDRVLFSSVHYPTNYGFIPQTYWADGDPLDVLVLGQEPVPPLTMMRVKPIGVMRMSDQGEADDKIISVHADDPEYASYQSLNDLPAHRMSEVRQFFQDYKILENKAVVVERFGSRDEAKDDIRKAQQFYQKRKSSLSSS